MDSRLSAGKARPKAKGTSPASTPRKSATQVKSPPKAASAKAKPGAREAKPLKPPKVGNPRTKPHGDTSTQPATGKTASQLIDQRIRNLGGWRGETLARMRALILEADPEMIEECKWVKPSNPFGVPVWSHAGIICTGESYKTLVKLTFAQGAKVPDSSHLFNSSLEGNTRRAIDIHEGEKVDSRAFKALVKAAVAHNGQSAKKR